MRRITIIGGGASGTLLAINLIERAAAQPLIINLIERASETGRGVAYGTAKDFHLLNVPAIKMGAFPERVADFHCWLAEKGFDYSPDSFVPRKIYGAYLRELFEKTIKEKSNSVEINIFRDEAVDILEETGETQVLLGSGEQLASSAAVLAFGNFLPPNVRTVSDDYTRSPKYFRSPWREDIASAVNRDENVLIIGTGLTAIDVILSLYHNQHRGKIYALSTHGLLPTVHASAAAYPLFQNEIEAAKGILQMFKIVRHHIARAEQMGSDWRAVIDSLRPVTQQLWYKLPLEEKRRFLRHLQRRWDVARHRMPPECFAILQNLQAAEQLQILRGRIRQIELASDDNFQIFYGAGAQIKADRVINCTGSQSNYARINAPLVKNLIARGAITPDALNLGLATAPTGAIINRRGEISKTLYTFATAQKGVLWECTAMPDIRVQAQQLAVRLLENSNSKI